MMCEMGTSRVSRQTHTGCGHKNASAANGNESGFFYSVPPLTIKSNIISRTSKDRLVSTTFIHMGVFHTIYVLKRNGGESSWLHKSNKQEKNDQLPSVLEAAATSVI
jgi:hypothetical protein